MKLGQTDAPLERANATFDLLRAQLEVQLQRPAVIAITSSTAEDGKEVAAWALAYSLATSGYPTLFVDTSLAGPSITEPTRRLRLDELAHQLSPSQGHGSFAALTLGDPTLQRTTSQRNITSAFEILRSKFDYVVVNTECGLSSSFAIAIVAAADSVLVTVKIGRREKDDDVRLSAALEQFGSRFLGVVALAPSVIEDSLAATSAPTTVSDWRPRQTAQMDKEPQRREVAEWPS